MTQRTVGWWFVAAQAALLVALVVIPTANHWSRPTWLLIVSGVLTVGGLGIVVLASTHLGSALTPTPEPNASGSLRTEGLYAVVRHPIYSGVLVIVIGLVVRSGSSVTLVVGLVTVGFFNAKAGWEERRLAQRYDGYRDYAAATPRFVPRSRRRVSP